MPNLSIEERLRHFFLAMGAQPTGSNTADNLAFTVGNDRIQVVLLKNETLLERGKIIDAIIGASSLRQHCELVYLAAPRLLGTSVPAQTFRSHGLGLLLFDDRKIQEAVAPEANRPAPASVTFPVPEVSLAKELTDLKSMYADLERSIGMLREEMDRLRAASINDRSAERRTGHVQEASASNVLFSNPLPPSNLPSFFAGNPWLEVLARRGRVEESTIAA